MGTNYHEGWICLHRKIIDSMVFQNEGLLKVWIWCLAKANHEIIWIPVSTGRGSSIVKVEPGQFIFGRKTAAKELKMKESSVHYRMKILEKHENLGMQPNSHYSIITIINWMAYQGNKIESNRQPNKQLAGNQQATSTDNNDNNDNNKRCVTKSRDAEARAREYSNEQNIETDHGPDVSKKKGKPVCPHQVIIEAYHQLCPVLPRVESWNDASQKVLATRWRERPERQEIEWWERYFKRVNLSDFLNGRVKEFTANLNWLIGPKNMEKVLNGFYDNRKAAMPERLRNNIQAGMEFINGSGDEI